jgi:hypothetical protein
MLAELKRPDDTGHTWSGTGRTWSPIDWNEGINKVAARLSPPLPGADFSCSCSGMGTFAAGARLCYGGNAGKTAR